MEDLFGAGSAARPAAATGIADPLRRECVEVLDAARAQLRPGSDSARELATMAAALRHEGVRLIPGTGEPLARQTLAQIAGAAEKLIALAGDVGDASGIDADAFAEILVAARRSLSLSAGPVVTYGAVARALQGSWGDRGVMARSRALRTRLLEADANVPAEREVSHAPTP